MGRHELVCVQVSPLGACGLRQRERAMSCGERAAREVGAAKGKGARGGAGQRRRAEGGG